MAAPLRIAMIASEAVPYAKTGGLADVVGSLPHALRRLGHDVRLILPKYALIDYARHGLSPFLEPLGVWMGDGQEWAAVHHTRNAGLPVYFIESNKYFDRWGIYHDADFHDYRDNARRFGFFTRAALQLCRDMDFSPDVVHIHDWQTALGAAYLKIWHWNDPVLGAAASLLTIHNIAYQGVYSAGDYNYLGLQWGNFTSDRFEDHGKVNFLKGGIIYADMVNTVSPRYAEETRTPEFAHGLAPYLNGKGDDYLGILNGVDHATWNPESDPYLPAHYSAGDLSGKVTCKRSLQQRFLLEQEPDMPLIGVVSRFVPQKGLDLLAATIEDILANMRVQFVILGAGDKGQESFFADLPRRYPGRVGSFIGYHEENSHWIEAGSDFFLMPSRFEPCGLNQIYSLKYGTLPIVRATGGLDDTVQQYNEANGEGTGFKFWEPSANALYYSVGWAVSTYYDRPVHIQQMVLRAMEEDYSWERSAREYEAAYMRARGKMLRGR
jgi:starch synthase